MGTRLINRTERLTEIEQMLFRSAMGMRAVEIAETCGVDRRTIYRDLALLEEIGVPIYQQDGRFYINREHYLANVRLSLNEAMALVLSARVFAQHTDQQNPALISALRKLSMTLPESVANHLAAITEMANQSAVDPGYVMVLETVIHAWSEKRKVKLWYNTGGTETKIHEFAIFFVEPTAGAEVYIVGFDAQAYRIRTLLLRGIKRVKLLRAAYEIPRHLNPRRYLASAWGATKNDTDDLHTVVLVFSANAAAQISQRQWHISQKIQFLNDGKCVLQLQVSDWREMVAWVRAWGRDVEALEPPELRRMLGQEAAHLAYLYNTEQ